MIKTLRLSSPVLPLLALACDGGGGAGAGEPCPPATTEAVALDTGTGVLSGIWEQPAGCGPFPVALVHVGSGPTDRDGNSAAAGLRTDCLKQLAAGLARRGVASVRYDKRGIAASAAAGPARERDYRFQTLVDDAARWVARLGRDPRVRGTVLVGHSEGALVTTLAAGEGGVKGLVAVAGAGRPAADVLREQLARQLGGELLARANAIIAELEAGREVAEVPPALAPLFRPSVQPYLIEWFAHDPAAALARLSVPALVVQGTTDIQIGVPDAERLAAARPGVELVVVEGMNHVLKAATLDPASQRRAYTDPGLPIVEAAVEAIAAFVLRAAR